MATTRCIQIDVLNESGRVSAERHPVRRPSGGLRSRRPVHRAVDPREQGASVSRTGGTGAAGGRRRADARAGDHPAPDAARRPDSCRGSTGASWTTANAGIWPPAYIFLPMVPRDAVFERRHADRSRWLDASGFVVLDLSDVYVGSDRTLAVGRGMGRASQRRRASPHRRPLVRPDPAESGTDWWALRRPRACARPDRLSSCLDGSCFLPGRRFSAAPSAPCC